VPDVEGVAAEKCLVQNGPVRKIHQTYAYTYTGAEFQSGRRPWIIRQRMEPWTLWPSPLQRRRIFFVFNDVEGNFTATTLITESGHPAIQMSSKPKTVHCGPRPDAFRQP